MVARGVYGEARAGDGHLVDLAHLACFRQAVAATMATPRAEQPDRIEVLHLVTAVLEVADLVTAYLARRKPDALAERALRDVLGAIDRLRDTKVTSLYQRARLESRALIAEIYKVVDDRGNLGDVSELAQSLCQPPTSQPDALRQVLMTDERDPDDQEFITAWSLTREEVRKKGGAMEAATLCVATFYEEEAPRTYYNWSKRHGPRPGLDDADASARFGVVHGPTAILEGLFTMLEVAPETARELSARLVAASPRLTAWENWERDR